MSQMIHKTNEIFTPGGMPTQTYIDRASLKITEAIEEAKNGLNKLVLVTGLTKSGKTVLVSRVFPKQDYTWFDGGSYNTEQDFWDELQDKMNKYNSIQENHTVVNTVEGTSEIRSELGGSYVGIFAKLQGILERNLPEQKNKAF